LRARFRHGYEQSRPLEPGKTEKYEIDMAAVGVRFQPGHRIRVEVSSSWFSRFDRNPQNGATNWMKDDAPPVVARQKIHHKSRQASFICLPVAVLLLCCLISPAQSESTAWPTYNNDYSGDRYSVANEITENNVDALKEVCRLKVSDGGSFPPGLVVVDGVMYVTRPFDTYALDATTCRVRWRYTSPGGAYGVNRGVAVMGGRVFRGTPDGHLLALDAVTGRLLWDSIVGDISISEFVFGAPLAWNGLVFAGVTASDGSIKGRIMAFDASTGREVWRFNTIPTGNEIGADTWKVSAAAETGGGGTWSTFTLDISSGELFVPVGSPAPIFLPDLRPGDNLFTDSFIVLDARTGALKWWYQLVPNDTHDLDLAAAPMLYINSRGERVVAAAGKDGYVHVVEQRTHHLLFKTAVTTIENEHGRPSETETRFCPSSWGGTEWNGPALDPSLKTIFVGAVDWCLLVKLVGDPNGLIFQPGSPPADTTVLKTRSDPDRPASGWLTAIDSDTGQVKWQYHDTAPIVAGVTPTAAGIVFTGDVAGNFLVFNSTTGRLLYKKNTGGGLSGGVITYVIDDKQYVAFTSGNGSRTFYGSPSPPSLIIMALNDEARRASVQRDAQVARGKHLYAENCSGCHGGAGEGGTGPALKGVKERRTYRGTIQWIKDPQTQLMPKLFPGPLNDQAVRDVATFIRTF